MEPATLCPLYPEFRAGRFTTPQTPEGALIELRGLLEKPERITFRVMRDGSNSHVRLEGRLQLDKAAMVGLLDGFPLLTPQEENRAAFGQVCDYVIFPSTAFNR